MNQWIVYYVCVCNLITFLVFGYDKYCAVKEKWRVPEKTLFLLAIIGGSAGAWAGMYVFRHKTRHKSFRLGIPVIFLIQVIIAGRMC